MKLGKNIEIAELKFMRNVSERLVNVIVLIIGVVFLIAGAISGKNPNLANIFYGVGGSLIASAVVSYLTSLYIYKRRKEKELTDYWGICEIFETRQKMNLPCDEYLERMEGVLDIASFGLKSFRDAQSDLIERKVKQGVKIRILCIHPDSPYLKQREKDEQEVDGQIRNTIIQLYDWVQKLKALSPKKDNIEIKFYDTLPLDFYFRIDNRLFVGPYLYGKGSQQTISYEFCSESQGFDYYANYYDDLWKDDYFPKRDYTPA